VLRSHSGSSTDVLAVQRRPRRRGLSRTHLLLPFCGNYRARPITP
jgi:hypothetical protein